MKNFQQFLLNEEQNQKVFKPNTRAELKEHLYDLKRDIKIDLSYIDTSNITDMSELFYDMNCKNFDISEWNVSNVTDMSQMFYKSNFNGNISKWNTSNVTDMGAMFCNSDFNGNISKWNTSNVRNMSSMFMFTKFNQDISKWNTSNVRNMSSMFYESVFNQPIGNWNTLKLEETNLMFYDSVFNQDISNWNVSNIKNCDMMFLSAKNFNQDISNWVLSSCKTHHSMFNKSPLENKKNFQPSFKIENKSSDVIEQQYLECAYKSLLGIIPDFFNDKFKWKKPELKSVNLKSKDFICNDSDIHKNPHGIFISGEYLSLIITQEGYYFLLEDNEVDFVKIEINGDFLNLSIDKKYLKQALYKIKEIYNLID